MPSKDFLRGLYDTVKEFIANCDAQNGLPFKATVSTKYECLCTPESINLYV